MLHSNIAEGDMHFIQQWTVADTTARDALSVAAADVGKVCEVGAAGAEKTFYILADDSPMTWTEIGGGGAGDVVGPASATDNAVVRFDGTTGKLIQNSAVTVADTTGDITAGKYNTVAISGASTPDLTVTGTTTVTGTNTGDQNLFSTIAVSGQSNVVADTTSDTLTLVAGTNITITTDAGTDSITINSSGGGGSGITRGTATTLTTQVNVDYGSLPSGLNRITVMWSSLSVNGTSGWVVRLGDSGGVENSGYTGRVSYISGTSANSYTLSSGCAWLAGSATNNESGVLTFVRLDGNTWMFEGSDSRTDASVQYFMTGWKTLSAELTTVQFITVNGTDQFDNGTINIFYE